jgi:hypothetical protein
MRRGLPPGVAEAGAGAAKAGVIESSNGKAMRMPVPWMKRRRETERWKATCGALAGL